MSSAKGSVLHSTLNFIAADVGPGVLKEIVARLPAEWQARVQEPSSTGEVPFDLLLALWHAADEVLGTQDTSWVERAGAHAIESVGMQLYGGILQKHSPIEFLTQPVSLFRLYYQPGNMEVVEHEPGRAVLRLVDWEEPDPLFCRRQTGGLRRAVELAGGKQPAARHVRCAAEGDAFCEWELKWE